MFNSKQFITSFLLVSLSFLAGGIFFALKNDILIIHCILPTASTLAHNASPCIYKKIPCFIWKKDAFVQEDQSILWHKDDIVSNTTNLINAWLHMLLEHRIITEEIIITTILFDQFQHECFVEFSQSFLDPQWPILDKWCTVQSLLKTLQQTESSLQLIQLLHNKAPLNDEHLEFSQPICIQDYIEEIELTK